LGEINGAKGRCGIFLMKGRAKHSTWIELKNTFAGLTRVQQLFARHFCSILFAICPNGFAGDPARRAPIDTLIYISKKKTLSLINAIAFA
jgi:hypothetical protein